MEETKVPSHIFSVYVANGNQALLNKFRRHVELKGKKLHVELFEAMRIYLDVKNGRNVDEL